MDNCITKILGLKDICAEFVKEDEFCIYFDLFTLPKDVVCPVCKGRHTHIHDYRTQSVKYLEGYGKHTVLYLKKRRYRCCGCGKRFFEHYDFLPRYHRMAQKVYTTILNTLRDLHNFKQVAKMMNVSTNTVARVFDIVNYRLYKLPEVLSFDEFKGNSGGQKYHFILTDPNKKKLLDIVKSREKSCLIEYFKSFKERNHVKMVIMDMWEPYKDIVKAFFPKATIVIDKYHYVRQVNWAVDKARKKAQKQLYEVTRKNFKKCRKLFLTPYNNLTPEQQLKLNNMLSLNENLKTAWELKELYYDFQNCTDITQSRSLLHNWLMTVQEQNIPEFKDCLSAFRNWFELILNSKTTPLTNGFTEGKNNKIKVLKRISFGYRNFDRFRNRILHCG